MNEDTKLECLRLAVDLCKGITEAEVLPMAKKFYEWVISEDKPNTIKYEKTIRERE